MKSRNPPIQLYSVLASYNILFQIFVMAPIRVKWDPEILAAGFRPSSIFDEVEAENMTVPVNTTASPALNVTGVINTVVRDTVDRVVALVVNTTVAPITTLRPVQSGQSTATPSWSSTSPTTFIKRAVERVALTPEVAVEHVSIIYTC